MSCHCLGLALVPAATSANRELSPSTPRSSPSRCQRGEIDGRQHGQVGYSMKGTCGPSSTMNPGSKWVSL